MSVDNKPFIRNLTLRLLKARKSRNIVAIFAIALTTFLFTIVFTLSGNMLYTIQEQTMRQVGTSAHGGLKMITAKQYDNFAKSPLIKDISFNRYLGLAENDALKKGHFEINYFEEKQAKWNFAFPDIGKMPQADDELVCSTITLDALGIPHKIGGTVPIMFSIGDKHYTKQFKLSGYWEGDAAASTQQIGVSRKFINSVISENNIPRDDYTGTISADVYFSNAVDIENKMEQLITERGYSIDDIAYGVNWAYATGKIDLTTVAIGAFVLILISLSGYLIIYSIFAISVTADIRFYGLLKTIGATRQQIRRIVLGQALILSSIGIPIGLLIGYVVGTLFVPIAVSFMNFDSLSARSANPLIFIFSVLFSLLTVFISCHKPGRIAAKVSPVEAVKFNDLNVNDKRKSKQTRAVTPFSFTWANITRNKKKLCVIVLSLSLSLILLNSVFSASKSFDMDKYVSESIISDFSVADYTVFGTDTNKNLEGVSVNFLREAKKYGATDISNIYYHSKSGTDVSTPLQIYGIDKTILGSFSNFNYEKLQSGNYCLVANYVVGDGSVSVPSVGDMVELTNDKGESREFEVAAITNQYPRSISSRFYYANGLTILLADDIFLNFFGSTQPMQTNFNTRPDKIMKLETWLKKYTNRENSNLDFISRESLKLEFIDMRNTYTTLGGCLAFVLALIGVLNFTNAIVASIYARRREFAMLQSVGMTGKQLKMTLLFEGSGYTFLTAMFTATVGFALTYFITLLIAGQAWFFKQSVTILPSIICFPILFILCATVPLVCYSKLTRESIIERLRME